MTMFLLFTFTTYITWMRKRLKFSHGDVAGTLFSSLFPFPFIIVFRKGEGLALQTKRTRKRVCHLFDPGRKKDKRSKEDGINNRRFWMDSILRIIWHGDFNHTFCTSSSLMFVKPPPIPTHPTPSHTHPPHTLPYPNTPPHPTPACIRDYKQIKQRDSLFFFFLIVNQC